jgi:hypothetical protein
MSRSPSTLLVPALQVVDVENRTTPTWPIQYTWLDPDDSAEWLETASEDAEFKNRKINARDLNLMKQTMENDGFIHFLPDGPFTFDERNILTNGKLRLTAAVETRTTIGVIVFRGVPRRLYAYQGTGRPKLYKHLRQAKGQMEKRDVLAVHKLIFLYEEVAFGVRTSTGWQDWGTKTFQPADLEHVGKIRSEVEDYYGNALAVRRGCRLVPTALMMFEFYQWHAWPEGREQMQEFLDSLTSGAVDKSVFPTPKNSPAISLRNFQSQYCPSKGKSMIHLMLLFHHFAAFVQGEPIAQVKWAYGMDLPLPYHPDGDAAARRNLRKLPAINQARTE